MKKFLFGLFTFSLGLVIGLFFKDAIFGLLPDMDDILKGGILVGMVILFFFLWRLSEWIGGTNKKEKKSTTPNVTK